MSATFNWYILYSNKKSEAKLAHLLSRKGYETYCPQYTETQKGHFNDGQYQKSLFSSWVFVRCTEKELNTIKNSDQSVKVVYLFTKPAVIEDQEISTIRYVLSNFREVQPIKTGMGTISSVINNTEDKSFFALPSIGFVLMADKEIQMKETFQANFKQGADLPSAGFLKHGRNTLALLKRIPFLFNSKVLKPSS